MIKQYLVIKKNVVDSKILIWIIGQGVLSEKVKFFIKKNV